MNATPRDVRCPVHQLRLFCQVTDDGNVEFACRDCCRDARRRDPRIYMVLHVYSPTVPPVLLQTIELTPVLPRHTE
jgi:hypothetical protein